MRPELPSHGLARCWPGECKGKNVTSICPLCVGVRANFRLALAWAPNLGTGTTQCAVQPRRARAGRATAEVRLSSLPDPSVARLQRTPCVAFSSNDRAKQPIPVFLCM